MKRSLAYFSICLLLVLGFVCGKSYQNTMNKSRNIALSVTYESLEDLCNNSEMIIKGKVSKNYKDVIISGEYPVKYRQYEVKIDKLFYNSTDKKVQKGDTLILSHPIEFGDFSVTDNKEFKPGSYTLFLNVAHVLDNDYYVPNTSNNIYMSASNDIYMSTIQGESTEQKSSIYTNVTGRGLKGFSEIDLENIIKKDNK